MLDIVPPELELAREIFFLTRENNENTTQTGAPHRGYTRNPVPARPGESVGTARRTVIKVCQNKAGVASFFVILGRKWATTLKPHDRQA